MNRMIAWTLPLAAGVAFASTAGAQATKTAAPTSTAPAQRPAAPQPTAPRAGVTGTPAKTAPAPALDAAAQKAAYAAKVRAEGQMEILLDEWEKQSSKVRSLQVIFERIDKAPRWGDKYYQGQAFLQSPDLACLEFKLAQVDKDGKPIYTATPNGQKTLAVEKDPAERIVCNGREVLQFIWDIREIYRYPLNKEAREKALQQGPLPFLFNMKAAEAKQRYSMTLIPQKDPAEAEKFYLIRIVPRVEIDQKSFREAYIYLSRLSFMPDRLTLFPVGNQERQDFRFTTILPNQTIPGFVFEPKTNMNGWKIIDNPDAAANPKAISAAPAAQPVAVPGRGGQVTPAANTTAPRRSTPQPQAPTRGTGRP